VWLRLGPRYRVVPELRRLTTTHPFHERFWAQLMIALQCDGRRAAALDTFASVATLLDSELGLGPGAELRELRDRIIAGEPFAAAGTREPDPRGPAMWRSA
jgi:DNA-binding SARP family transcriptional activator